MSAAPVVALISPGGFLGSSLLPYFVDATKTGTFSALRLVTTNASKLPSDFGSPSVSVAEVDYTRRETLVTALKGVNVVVSAMTIDGPDHNDSAQHLIEAAAEAGVKTYFPSEAGYDYDGLPIEGTLLEEKSLHRDAAEKLGLKAIGFAVGGFLETFFALPVFGRDGDTWYISGDGTKPFALTGLKDIARYLVRAVAVAHSDPHLVGRRVRVYTILKSFNDYADIVERVAGRPVKRVYQSQQELDEIYASGKEGPYFALRRFSYAANFTGTPDIDVLNPGQKYFEPVKFEDFIPAPDSARKDQ